MLKEKVVYALIILLALMIFTLVPIPTLGAPLPAKGSEVLKEAPASLLDKQIEEWIQSMAKQGGSYRDFSSADWTREPIGAGMHGWIVILEKDGKEIGYLVVGAKPDGGYVLTEFGTGAYPLFSLHTLYRSLQLAELLPAKQTFKQFSALPAERFVRLYESPLEAVWVWQASKDPKDRQLIDAKTGELYGALAYNPNDDVLYKDNISSDAGFSQFDMNEKDWKPSFDAYQHLFWLNKKPFARSFSSIEASLKQHKRTVYVTTLFDEAVTQPVSVIGAVTDQSEAQWIVLDQDGTRIIPFELLQNRGSFYSR